MRILVLKSSTQGGYNHENKTKNPISGRKIKREGPAYDKLFKRYVKLLGLPKLPVLYNNLSVKEKRIARNRYIGIQNSKCWHCKSDIYSKPPTEITEKPLDMKLFPDGFLNYPIHLHHSHVTGMTIGAVHAYCNGVLFQYFGE